MLCFLYSKACTSRRECDITTCCFRDMSTDKKPKPLNPKNTYQQFKILRHHAGGFFAKSVAPGGLPPKFLRRKGWTVRCSGLNRLSPIDAPGLDSPARAPLPGFDFSAYNSRSPRVEVGKWLCPFPFVKERGIGAKRQMRKSLLYTVTLEQCWEEIFSAGNSNAGRDAVRFEVDVKREASVIGGFECVRRDEGSMSWFRVYNPGGKKGVIGVGLSYAIVEHMRWVLEEGGWVSGGGDRDGYESVRVEESGCVGVAWKRFCCYVLVESFVLRRLDGTLVLKCSFRHTHRIKCKWE